MVKPVSNVYEYIHSDQEYEDMAEKRRKAFIESMKQIIHDTLHINTEVETKRTDNGNR